MKKKNAIRYAAGYITRALVKKLKRSSHPMKEELVCCLIEMNNKESGGVYDASHDWMETISRGGLKHVNDNHVILPVCSNGI